MISLTSNFILQLKIQNLIKLFMAHLTKFLIKVLNSCS